MAVSSEYNFLCIFAWLEFLKFDASRQFWEMRESLKAVSDRFESCVDVP
jgi:hypothetical protein